MATQDLSGSYLAYKKDTSMFLKWIVQTSQSCNYSAKLDSYPTKSGRLKGKARKEAKLTAAKEQSGSIDSSELDKIPISQYLARAKHIAAIKPKLLMPTEVYKAAMNAVKMREKFTNWFFNNRPQEEDANSGHARFVGFLKEALDELASCIPSPAKAEQKSKAKGKETSHGNLSNIFCHLAVEDPVDSPQDTGTLPSAPRKDVTDTHDVAKSYKKSSNLENSEGKDNPSKEDEEKSFAVYCFFKDLNRIREYLWDVWKAYEAEELDLMSATMITDAGIRLVKRLEIELRDIYPELVDFESILNSLPRSVILDISAENSTGRDDLDAPLGPTSKWFMASAATGLWSSLDVIKAGPLYEHEKGWRDASRFYSEPESRYTGVVIVRGLIAELMSGIVLTNSPFSELDVVSFGLSRFVKTGVYEWWLVFGCQIMIDIYHNHLIDVEKPYRDMFSLCKSIQTSINSNLEFAKSCGPEHQYYVDNLLGLINDINVEVFDDPILAFNVWISNQVKEDYMEAIDNNLKAEVAYLLKRQPLLCGTILKSIVGKWAVVGRAYALITRLPISGAHLYNALKVSGKVTNEWEDLEYFVKIWGEDRIFRGQAPSQSSTPHDICRRYALVQRLDTRNIAESWGKKDLLPKLKLPGTKIFSPLPKVFHALMESYSDITDSDPRSNQLVGALMEQVDISAQQNIDDANTTFHVRLLESLKVSLTDFCATFYFDYLSLCRRMMKLYGNLKEISPSRTSVQRPPSVQTIHDTAEILFAQAFFQDEMKERTRLAKKGRVPEFEASDKIGPFDLVGPVIQTFIKESGRVQLDDMKALSNPKHYDHKGSSSEYEDFAWRIGKFWKPSPRMLIFKDHISKIKELA